MWKESDRVFVAPVRHLTRAERTLLLMILMMLGGKGTSSGQVLDKFWAAAGREQTGGPKTDYDMFRRGTKMMIHSGRQGSQRRQQQQQQQQQ
jgi:hypothetical protein